MKTAISRAWRPGLGLAILCPYILCYYFLGLSLIGSEEWARNIGLGYLMITGVVALYFEATLPFWISASTLLIGLPAPAEFGNLQALAGAAILLFALRSKLHDEGLWVIFYEGMLPAAVNLGFLLRLTGLGPEITFIAPMTIIALQTYLLHGQAIPPLQLSQQGFSTLQQTCDHAGFRKEFHPRCPHCGKSADLIG